MVHFTSFVLFVSILLSIVSITAQTQNQLGSKGTQQCTINNNFYAGSNKRVETVMFEMKKQLDEIQKELRNLTQKTKKENKTKGSYLDSLLTLYHFSLWIKFKYNVPTLGYRRRKSWSQRYHSWHCTWERVCNFLSLGLFFDKISLNYSHLITVFA